MLVLLDMTEKTRFIGLRIPESLFNAIDKEAETDEISISDVARRVLNRHYKNQATENA